MAKFYRTMVVNGETWRYRIGKNYCNICAPNGKSFSVDLSRLTGRDWDTLERGQYKRTQDGMVYPSHIRDYIDSLKNSACNSMVE